MEEEDQGGKRAGSGDRGTVKKQKVDPTDYLSYAGH